MGGLIMGPVTGESPVTGTIIKWKFVRKKIKKWWKHPVTGMVGRKIGVKIGIIRMKINPVTGKAGLVIGSNIIMKIKKNV